MYCHARRDTDSRTNYNGLGGTMADIVTPKQLILDNLVPHVCSEAMCGYHPEGRNPHHDGTFELDSDVFILATEITPKRYDGTRLAPD